tara:strand:+ start:474 stop:1775 length:1302 start_codon:yes stop_codon:yes gene_type:complete
MNNSEYLKAQDTLNEYEANSMHGQLPVYWKSAKGCIVKDHNNKKFIDFTSTIFVTNIGHSNRYIKNAIRKVLNSNLIHSYTYLNEFRVNYIKELVEFCGANFEKAYLASSGTEATETALKLMRMYGLKLAKKRKPGIVSIIGNYHGRTMGSFMMSGFPKSKWWIGYHDPNIHFMDFPYPWEITEEKGKEFFYKQIENLETKGVDFKNDISGIILETFQGWGALFYPKTYVKALNDFAKKYNILICFDEMQAGFYRTGKKFGYEHYDVYPDIICIGKGMSSGLPLSGVVSSKEILDLPQQGELSSTNSANPMVCSVGLATIRYMNKNSFIKLLNANCEFFNQELSKIQKEFNDRIRVFGKGMIAALVVNNDKGEPDVDTTNLLVEDLLNNGLLVVKTGRESIKLGPPLNIKHKYLKQGLKILHNSIKKTLNDSI